MYLQNSGLDRCVVLHTSTHYWSILIPSCSDDDKEYKHTMIRAKSAPYAPSAMYRAFFPFPIIIPTYVQNGNMERHKYRVKHTLGIFSRGK